MDNFAQASAGSEPVQPSKLVEKPDKLTDPGEAKSGPPTLSEWQDFFARFVIRLIVNGYLYFVLGDLMDELTPREADQIALSKEDMAEMAAPLAEMANKSKYARKHGRTIVAFADSYESIFNMLLWMRRVNKIARKHKKARQASESIPGEVINPTNVYANGESNAQPHGSDFGQSNGIPQPQFGVFNPGSG